MCLMVYVYEMIVFGCMFIGMYFIDLMEYIDVVVVKSGVKNGVVYVLS